jgi:hypothetical protein
LRDTPGSTPRCLYTLFPAVSIARQHRSQSAKIFFLTDSKALTSSLPITPILTLRPPLLISEQVYQGSLFGRPVLLLKGIAKNVIT